ncbi:MAG: 4-phosphoerythronate dehydrogenase [Bacteroidota bacterium]
MSPSLTIVANKNTPYVIETFDHLGKIVALETREVTREAVRDADILIVRSETKVGKDLLEGSRVRFVGTVTIGTDHVDLEYLKKQNIAFASAPGSNSQSVAEYVTSALCVLARRKNASLSGKTLGVVGVGNVGSKVVNIARALGMNVLENDPPRFREAGDRKFVSLDELMGADIISLHVPLTKSGQDATYHLFDEKRLGRMKRGAVLVNTSRGPVIEPPALKQMLETGHLSAAILDVWEGEPSVDTGLLQSVFLGTPHIAGYSLEGKVNAVQMIYEALCSYLSVPALRRAQSFLPRIASGPVSISVRSLEEALLQAMRPFYDIEQDDRQLREIIAVPQQEHAAYFMRLRANYRVRREFVNGAVSLSSSSGQVEQALKALRFNVTSPKQVESWTR